MAPFPANLKPFLFVDSVDITDDYSFNANFTSNVRSALTVSDESFLRISAAPLVSDYTILVSVLNQDGTQVILYPETRFQMSHGLTYGHIQPGDYLVQFAFTKISSTSEKPTDPSCIPARVAVGMRTVAEVADHASRFKNCPAKSTIPPVDFSPLSVNANVDYDSDDFPDESYAIVPTDSSLISVGDERYAGKLVFDIPAGYRASFQAAINLDFTASGYFSLVLESGIETNDPEPPVDLAACVSSDTCDITVAQTLGGKALTRTLTAGKYALWFMFSQPNVPTPEQTYSPCAPYGLSLRIQLKNSGTADEDNYVKCNSLTLPERLDGTEADSTLFIQYGIFYLNRRILLEASVPQHKSSFKITQTSLFRLRVDPHQVDIDVFLHDSNGNIVAHASRITGEEHLAVRLDPDDYDITVLTFGSHLAIDCDFYELEISIEPVSFTYSDFCTTSGQTTELPDLTQLDDLGKTIQEFHFAEPFKTYNYAFPTGATIEQVELVRQNFTLSQNTRVVAHIVSDFLRSDVTFHIEDRQNPDAPHIDPTHDKNSYDMLEILPAGTYAFVIETGHVQENNPPPVTDFLPCAPFRLSLSMVPPSYLSEADNLCGSVLFFPRNVSYPGILATSNLFHVAKHYRAPPVNHTHISETSYTEIKTRVDSLLRVTVPRMHLDIDLKLLDTEGHVLARSEHTTQDEDISYMLQANTDYNLAITFYHFNNTVHYDAPCYTYFIDFSLTPSTVVPTACTDERLPPSNLVPSTIPDEGFFHEDTYQFVRTGQHEDPSTYITFTVSNEVKFRATVQSDNIFSPLDMTLLLDSSSVGTEYDGTHEYNLVEVGTYTLPPGTYTLLISAPVAPSRTPYPMNQSCLEFYFRIGLINSVYTADDDNKDNLPYDYSYSSTLPICDKLLPAPITLNAPGFLHTIDGNTLYLGNSRLVDKTTHRDLIDLKLDEDSIVKVFIPAQISVDVDVALRQGTRTNPGIVVFQTTGSGDEGFTARIAAGTYVLDILYYTWASDKCIPYVAQVGVMPISEVNKRPDITTECDPNYPDKIALINTDVSGTYNWNPSRSFGLPVDGKAYNTTIEFDIAEGKVGTIDVELAAEFITSGLAMTLQEKINMNLLSIENNVSATYSSHRAYISEILWPGHYILHIMDTSSPKAEASNGPSELKCGTYRLTYHINNDTKVDPGTCIHVEKLPTDLNDTNGGSLPYGGPQQTDGTVYVSGEHFFLSTAADIREQWTSFAVPSEGMAARFAVQIPEAGLSGSDIDIYVYENRSDLSTLVATLMGTDAYDSGLYMFTPKGGKDAMFSMKTFGYNVDVGERCVYFRWAVGLMSQSQVRENLRCPAILPSPTGAMPPSTIVVGDEEHKEISGENYMITHDVFTTYTKGGKFEYPIVIDAQDNVTLGVSVRYNFVINDLRLELKDHQSGRVWMRSVPEDAGSSHGYFNRIASFPLMGVPQGKYIISIVDDVSKENITKFAPAGAFCEKFAFTLTARRGHRTPRTSLVAIQPSSIDNFEPCDDIRITLMFNDLISNAPSLSSELVSFLTTENIVKLVPVNNTSATEPCLDGAILSDNLQSIQLLFSMADFAFGNAYKLTLDVTKLKNSTGAPFSDAAEGTRIYKITDCDCSGHGKCKSPGPKGECVVCECEGLWAGTNCDGCKDGYHYVEGYGCVGDESCDENSCSGHGTCDNSTGVIKCMCDPGYASSEKEMCDMCAWGYEGYPKCTKKQGYESSACKSLILPETMDSPQYNGWDMHPILSGEYWIDLTSMTDEFEIVLTEDVLFRAHTANENVDVDMWLFKLNPDGTVGDSVASGTSISDTETIFVNLTGGTKEVPVKYLLRFYYYISGTSSWSDLTDCETFQLELEMEPYTKVMASLEGWNKQCPKEDVLPVIPVHNITTNYTYNVTDKTYAIHRPSGVPVSPNFFWSHQFRIDAVDDHMPLLRAFVGSRFLFGQINFVLERIDGRQQGDYCLTEMNFKDRCARGDNTLNGNYIERIIEPGRYVLWMYEPILQDNNYVNCSQFEFSFSVTYVDSSSEFWECDSPELPIDLNKAHYMHDDGSMHFHEVFHTAGVRSTGFSVKAESLFRIGSNGDIKFTLTNSSDMKVIVRGAYDIFTVLTPGYYTLAMHSPLSVHPTCMQVDIEAALFPFNLIKAGTACSTSSLPDLTQVAVPYSFPNDTLTFCATPYTTQNTEVARYPIFISETAVFFAALSSDFAVHDLRMVLINSTSGNIITKSMHNFNHHYIQERLPAGQYSLILEVPSVTGRDSRLPKSIPFNFDLQIRRYNASSAISVCLLDGHELPASFNNERFLAAASSGAQSLTFADFEVRVPAGIIVTAQREIPMTYTADSTLFRAYIEPNNAIDVDIYVMKKGSDIPVASGTGGIGTEEVITTLLPKGEYTLRLVYWVWDKTSLPLCPKFKMQVMATPILNPCNCTDGDKWPSGIPAEITSSYRYSSREQYVDLQFGQHDMMRFYAIPFKLKREMNFYSTITYDLRDTQIALRLDRYSSTGNRTMSYYGEPSYGRSTINLRRLPVGDYILMIYEGMRSPQEARTCVHYAFDFAVQEPSSLWTNEHASLPTSLDGLPYLGFDKSLDIFDTYMLFRFGNQEDTFFSLQEDSYVRISAEFEDVGTAVIRPTIEDIEIQVTDTATGKVVSKYLTHMHVRLAKGKYKISFVKKAEAQALTGEGIETQLAIHIQTVESAQADVKNAGEAGIATCTDSLVPSFTISPDGFYQYDGYKHQVCETTLAQQTLQTLNLDLTQESVVWIRVGFEFAFSHIDVLVTLEDGTFMRSLLSRNSHGFRGLVPAGHHTVTLSSPGHFTHDHDELPRCTPFSFSVVISPDDEKSRCAYLDTVPWNLNRYDGGSLRFGGPLDPVTGVLDLYGDEFGVPPGHYSDTMDIDIVNDSLVSIFLSAQSQMSTVSARLIESGTGEEVSPLGFQESNGQRQFLSTWKVEPRVSGKKSFKIILDYDGLYGSCGAFTMQLSVRPMEMVQADTMCDGRAGHDPDYPEHTITIDDEGFGQDLHDTFTVTNDTLNNGHFYFINFTAKESETVTLSISFSAFVNLYETTLYKKESNTQLSHITSGTLRAQRQMAGDTTITRYVFATVDAGDYVFLIHQNPRSFKFPFDLTVRPPMCPPFLYTAQIFPNNGIPYVADVSPASARNLDPQANVNLFLQFSESIFDKRSGNLAEPAAIAESFTLVRENEETHVDKSMVTVRKLSSDSSSWSVSFNGTGVFEANKTVKLNLTTNFLVDSDNKVTRYNLINRYSMIDTTCSGHGVIKNSVCVCEQEYGGATCDRCNMGYTRIQGTDPRTFRCIPAVKCEVDTCGCEYDRNGTCTPLGKCYIDQTTGLAKCTCNDGYAGPYCRTCQDHYVGWPICVHCMNGGKWHSSTKKCSCPTGFAGRNCQKCAFGYSGTKCKVNSSVVIVSIAIVVFVIIAVLIIVAVHFHKKDKLKPVKYAPVSQFDDDDDGESYDTVFGGDLSKGSSVNAGGFSYTNDGADEQPNETSGNGGDTDEEEETAKKEERASDLRIEAAFADK